MAISFNQVPANIRTPFTYIEFDASKAVGGATVLAFRNLIIGQRLAAGTVAALVPVRVTSAAQANTFFGQGSMLAAMVATQLMNDDVTETWAVALDDNGAGVQAAGSVTIAGAPTAAGIINIHVAGRRIQAAVATTDTAAAIANAIATAIINDLDGPVTANVDVGTPTQVDITARHAGEAGNDLDIRVNYYDGDVTPAGVTVAIAAMAGGVGNPDISTIWPVLGDDWYNGLTMPYNDAANLTALESELTDRDGPLQMIDARAITGFNGTHAEMGTHGDSRNSQFLSVMGALGPTPPYLWAAAVAGNMSYFGSIDPARPFQTLRLVGILPPERSERFTQQERDLLLHDGISTFTVDNGGVVRIERLITTYKTNAAGADDTAFLDVTTGLTLSYLRYDFRNYILVKYPRHKLADDGIRIGRGQAVMTPKLGRAEAYVKFRQWEELGLVENFEAFKAALIVERNAQDPNRLDWYLPPDLVNQLIVNAVQIGFRL